jgi:predicted acetylornithine/succinylornithine family transaminase
VNHVINTYARQPVKIVKGKGCWIFDDAGKGYLDMVAGIAVCNLGHANPEVAAALKEQADRLFHCSNLYEIPQQELVAGMLSELAFPAEVFFCNSGAEANEGAIKLVRRYCNTKAKRGPRIITAHESFHGRTLATLAATGQTKYRAGFDPIPEGFLTVPFGDVGALKAAITPEVGGIMLEPIQGEGGVNIPVPGYFAKVRELCDKEGILFVLDEVQTGMARTGRLFAHQHDSLTPDIMTLAKALGNGFPVGAVVARPDIAQVLVPGTHASTFGGNPLAMAASLATLTIMLRDNIATQAFEKGAYLMERLQGLKKDHPTLKTIRGRGLMVGAEFDGDISFMPAEGLKRGIMLNVIHGRILRLVPPLVISTAEIDQALEIIEDILKEKGL